MCRVAVYFWASDLRGPSKTVKRDEGWTAFASSVSRCAGAFRREEDAGQESRGLADVLLVPVMFLHSLSRLSLGSQNMMILLVTVTYIL
jgi:hypothetical protein